MSDQPKFAVIGDTNFYRGVGDDRLTQIRRLEAAADVAPVAAVIVGLELCPLLVSPEARTQARGLGAIRRFASHCFSRPRSLFDTGFAEDPMMVLGSQLSKQPLTYSLELASIMRSMIEDSARFTELPHHVAVSLTETLRIAEGYRDQFEEHFVAMLRRLHRSLGLDPENPSDFPPNQRPTVDEFLAGPMLGNILSEGLAMSVANEMSLELDGSQRSAWSRAFAVQLPAVIEFHRRITTDILVGGTRPSKHANSFFDARLAGFASPALRVLGAPTIVVTDDRRVLAAVSACHASHRAMPIDDYVRFLVGLQQ